MIKRSLATILVATSVTALAAPVLAETSLCTVKAPEIRLRKTPSKKAHVIAVLKKDTRVNAETCSGGWVKVVSENGKVSGYVGGWALAAEAPKTAQAPVPTPVVAAAPIKPEVAKVETITAPLREAPSNEKLAVQITELRLNVLSIERDMDKMGKDIQKIKNAIRHKPSTRKVANSSGKGRKLVAKR